MRSQSPETFEPATLSTQLVGDLAVPTGLQPVKVEAVGMINGLHGTGSDPAPSPQRAALLTEMQTRKVTNPNAVLASGNVSLVLVQGWMKAGIQKGDHFDIEVRVPSQSETTSLRGGYLLETRLMEMAILDQQLRHGNLLALAQGPVLVDPTDDPKKDRILLCRGRVLRGGVARKSRPLGLVLMPEHQNVLNSARVANAVNRRFHTYRNGVKVGVAKAISDELIELTVHPRYKENITRYVKVVRSLAISESAPKRMKRIAMLQDQLLEPTTSADAAIQLEALGFSGADALLKGIKSKDPEVRFYSAEALAYLDRREAAEPLGQIAREQPAFRVFGLTALSAMQDFAAYDQLQALLSLPSAETRYGAFRALWAMNPNDPLVKGELLGDQFNYHVLDVGGPAMIHVTRNRLTEVILFGPEQKLSPPMALNAGNEIMVTSAGGDEISVSQFSVADGDQKRIVSPRVDDVIRAVVELGGTYPDVVQVLQEAKASGALASRFEVDALPEAGRMYDRVARNPRGDVETDTGESETSAIPASPSPELFSKRPAKSSSTGGDGSAKSAEKFDENAVSDAETNTKKSFFARILGR